jgi:hypothetical protein
MAQQAQQQAQSNDNIQSSTRLSLAQQSWEETAKNVEYTQT